MENLSQEESVEEMYNEAPCGYFSALPDGIITKINQTLLNWLGYSEEEIVGKLQWTDFLTMGGKIYHQTHFIPLLYIQDFLQEINLDFKKKDGERIPVLINARAKKDHFGKLVLLRISVIQFKQRKLYEQEIINSKKQAVTANNAKSEFLSNMSHEIRTPLNAVIGFTDLLTKTQLSEVQAQYLAIVNKSANSLLDLLNDILDLSKIEAGKLEISTEKVDIVQLLEESVDIINYKAEYKGLEIILNLSPNLPKFIFTDPVRFRQIIINLLGNAVKFTESGEIELKAEVLEKNLNRKNIEIFFSVRDTGIGISVENQEKIFESFSQADSSISRKFGGTGLGLSISNKLLDLIGTQLELKSEYGKGSEFFFKLKTKFEEDIAKWNGLENIKRVLILNSSTKNLEIISRMLLSFDIQHDLVLNKENAIDLILKNGKYDVFIIDYHLVEKNGIEILKEIRNSLKITPEDLPIVILHKYTEGENFHESCEDLNIKLKVLKPVKKKELFEVLKKFNIDKWENKTKSKFQDNNNLPYLTEEETTDQNSSGIKILVVDDDTVNRLLAKTILKQLIKNVTVLEAVDGKEAVEIFKLENPNLIFMDIQMPILNGYETTVEIRKLEIEKNIPIIALTAGTLKDIMDKYVQAGMDDYVSKPFKKDKIQEMLKKWLPENK